MRSAISLSEDWNEPRRMISLEGQAFSEAPAPSTVPFMDNASIDNRCIDLGGHFSTGKRANVTINTAISANWRA
ncbi:hypothetical protein [Sinorhizobium meliloti]|uniref:hypothetical protein n=1 Tax=Rhizobium meliloti TaxID=382 RepID=UPI000FD441BA|nr:hypothetical protein [Sinorhizobium meliloti]MDW9358596.1 hypothetical protein [Sinorhizobium meliloti]MDW9527060.1 hypothetical protein [Sinorhizobium meliloti]MDW9657942.1 hypothetical protein [Sinorhizobium meliloti]MDW9880767.1 hypothetical protein [Sinorhizobium meliloti]MDW9917867.1 hypothetical protein [Sinorhizobium meliloti]